MSTAVEFEPITVAEPGTPEWHAARLTGIGASEAAAACGSSRYSTPYEIFCRKRGLLEFTNEDNEAMKWGRLLEPVVVREFSNETGIDIQRYPCPMLRHPEHAFMLATPDAELVNAEILDAKTTRYFLYREHWGEEGSDDTPDEINCQGQQQLAVTGREVCHIATLVDGRGPLHFHKITRNDEQIRHMVRLEKELWERIQNNDPPPIDYKHKSIERLMKKLHRKIDERAVVLPYALALKRMRYNELAALIKPMDDEKKAISTEILHAIGDASLAVFEASPDGKPCEFEMSRTEVKESTRFFRAHFRINQRKSR